VDLRPIWAVRSGSVLGCPHGPRPEGLFNLAYGVARFAGSAALGLLYGFSIPALAASSVVVEPLAVPLLLTIRIVGRAAA
jgi:hypothetical protein